MGTKSGTEKDLWFNNEFEEGEYVCALFVSWNSFVTDAVLSGYGPDTVEFIELEDEERPKNFFKKITFDHIKNFNNNDWIFLPNGRNCKYKIDLEGSIAHGYCAFENQEENSEWNVSLSFPENSGVKAVSPFDMKKTNYLTIPPKSMECIIFLFTHNKSAVTTKFSSSFKDDINTVKAKCIAEGAKNERKNGGKSTGIFLYGLMHT